MVRGLTLVLALGVGGQVASDSPTQATLTLELRIFDGGAEVTSHTRLTVHRAGEREAPLAQTHGSPGPVQLNVPEGIYDVQAVHLRDTQVVNIRWANRLVVMPYPDEGGRHLEVVNFQSGFGALQVRTKDGRAPHVSLHAPGQRDKRVAAPVSGPGYALFVVPAGTYDLHVTDDDRAAWHTDIEVPLDRTRLWLQP